MKTYRTASMIITTLAISLILGCSSLPPISGSYTDEDGNVVTVSPTPGGGLDITYVTACQTCNAPIPSTASTPEVPAECDTCAPKRQARQQGTPIDRLQPGDPRPVNVSAACAGLIRVNPAAYRGWRGACPGADIDAWAFQTLMHSYDHPAIAIYNQQATAAGVIAAADQALGRLTHGGLLLLSISGHGTRTRDSDGDETTGYDSQLCLYDGLLTDDTVWILLGRIHAKRPDVRILMISDTCHSGSVYRSPRPLSLAARIRAETTPTTEPDLLHFAGASDTTYAYGSSQGGVFTTALIDSFDPSLSYIEWFNAARRLVPSKQTPVCEWTGTYFGDRKLFR